MPIPYAYHFYPHLHSPQTAPYDPDIFTLPPRLNIIPPSPRNPFSIDRYRAQRLAHEDEDASYRAYQLACYAAPPFQTPRAEPAITVDNQPQWDSDTSSLQATILLLGVLLGLPVIGWRAVARGIEGLIATVGAAVRLLRLWYGIYVYGSWLAHRPLRMLLLGLAARVGCVGVLLHMARGRIAGAEDGPRYVLVHECRVWSGPFEP